MKLFRIILQVGDLDSAAAFYGELLGLEGRKVGGGRVYLDCGAVIVALLGVASPEPAPEHSYFAVADLEAVFARARALGALATDQVHGEPAGAIVVRPWHERSFYAVDPWRNGLCFVDETTLFTGRR
jgi:catechol 2,3-dioxygenase-like lactoylglutathione lyase family enzyme